MSCWEPPRAGPTTTRRTTTREFVDVTGLHGRFLLVLIADPDNVILESREDNNRASRAVQIP